MIMGGLFVVVGICMIAGLNGVTFLSVAFVLGLLFMIAGISSCLSYKSYRDDSVDKTWVVIDGATTFVLGFLIIFNKLASDAAVPLVMGLWVAITGIRNLTKALEKFNVKDSYFYGHLAIGAVNGAVGLYMFFNNDLLMLPVGVLVGICVLVQGLNIFMVAVTIIISKSRFIMNKEELLEQAAEEVEKAHEAAKEAIKVLKEAKANVEVIKETPEEKLDAALVPKPAEAGSQESGAAEELKRKNINKN